VERWRGVGREGRGLWEWARGNKVVIDRKGGSKRWGFGHESGRPRERKMGVGKLTIKNKLGRGQHSWKGSGREKRKG